MCIYIYIYIYTHLYIYVYMCVFVLSAKRVPESQPLFETLPRPRAINI